jgi:hypothetical protein
VNGKALIVKSHFSRRIAGIEAIEPRVLLWAGQLDGLFGNDGVTTIAMPSGAVAELHDLEPYRTGASSAWARATRA